MLFRLVSTYHAAVPTYDLLVVGHPSIDLMFAGLPQWPEVGLDLEVGSFGMGAGTSFNTPAAANRLGLRVGYVALVGTDLWSDLVRREFATEGLPDDLVQSVDHPAPFVSVALNHDQDRGFVTYEASDPDDDRLLQAAAVETISSVNARHFHGYAGTESTELSEIAHRRGMTVSLDAWGGPWWDELGALEDILRHADIVFANESEALAMTGAGDARSALTRLGEFTPCVVIKRSADGSIGLAGGEAREAPAEPANVLDTTGAGDCFNAGFLVGWLAGLPLEENLILGNLCGARAIEAFGGYRGCPDATAFRRMANERGIELPALEAEPA
jgi:sugar/nucleoside kinase (ribokinase family)